MMSSCCCQLRTTDTLSNSGAPEQIRWEPLSHGYNDSYRFFHLIRDREIHKQQGIKAAEISKAT